jgi:hypothetical protein
MPISLRGTTNSSFRLGAGNVTNPSLSFVNNPSTGLFLTNGNIGISVNGTESMQITPSGILVNGNVTCGTLYGDGSSLTSASFNTYVSNVQVANSTYVVQDDTSVDTAGGFVVVNGSGFLGGSMVLVGGTPATSTTVLGYTKLGAAVQPKASGTYSVTVVRPDSISVNVPLGITYSPSPVWGTSSQLANVTKYTDFTQTLSASEANGSPVTYALVAGSSLPPGTTLTTSGVFNGNITVDPGNTTMYSFVIDAVDSEYQNIPRTFSLYALYAPLVASGGTVATSGAYTVHTFTTSGSFTISSNPTNKTLEILIVAGGGGGGGGHAGGGGGGGGLISSTAVSATSGTYTITVGGGGTGGSGPPLAGSNSSAFGSTAIGGGRGGQESYNPGGTGGSGGGGCGVLGNHTGGSGTAGQGYAGGSGNNSISGGYGVGGGGGGAGQAGANAFNSGGYGGGNGGNGLSSSITGTAVYYAGGGGGGGWIGYVYGGIGGLGGGGYSVSGSVGLPGTANTGGGGAGGDAGASPRGGGAGGSGIVIIRYIA